MLVSDFAVIQQECSNGVQCSQCRVPRPHLQSPNVPKTLAFANRCAANGAFWAFGCGSIDAKVAYSSQDCVHGISSIVHWKLDCNFQSFKIYIHAFNMHIIIIIIPIHENILRFASKSFIFKIHAFILVSQAFYPDMLPSCMDSV